MFIIRPLLYVLLIRKYGTRSWFPWFTSLAVDLLGNGILSYVTILRSSREDPFFQLSNHERDEVCIFLYCIILLLVTHLSGVRGFLKVLLSNSPW